jgi:hypothetical protein
MKIHSYVVARDFGFAPNPFFGYCTLANCKPIIRKHANIGDFIVGTKRSPHPNRIVFFMKIEEILNYNQYWDDERFYLKKPNFKASMKFAFGDNIYHQQENGFWCQENSHHTNEDGSRNESNLKTDISGSNVLISTDFCYWGEDAPLLPNELNSIVKRGPGHKSDFSKPIKETFLRWIAAQSRGIVAKPIDW